jgi:DNA-binding GntR family transcriptional regulator
MKRIRNGSRASRADRSIRTQAYEYIHGMIVSGELVDGAISELAIAQELGISRTPIREAIGQLLAEGLLEQTPNRGTTVVQLKRQDIIDLYELREVLECYAAGKAARLKPYPSELEQWQKHADEILVLKEELEKSGKPRLNAEQMRRFMVSDHSFHAMLMHLAANARMLKAVNDSRVLIRIFAMGHQAYDASQLDRLYHQHDQIIRAVADQNPELATKLIAEHIRTSGQERLLALDAWERDVAMRKNVSTFI